MKSKNNSHKFNLL